MLKAFTPDTSPAISEILFVNSAPNSSLSEANIATTAVSYTHLDVYKRQSHSS